MMGCFDMSFPHLISVTKLCTSGNGKIRPWVYLALTFNQTQMSANLTNQLGR
jgi:hypothetical protein